MRAAVLSHLYMDPARRGKLRSLASLGCSVCVAVPDRWVTRAPGSAMVAAWSDDGGVRVVPIPVAGGGKAGQSAPWSARALRRLFNDFRPEILQIEEEPWTPVAATASGLASRLRFPAALFSWENLPRSLPVLTRWRRRRTLARANGIVGGNRGAANLLTRERPDIPASVIPQYGVVPPLEVRRDEHEGLAIGFVGRLVPEKGLDILMRACVKLLGRWTLTVVGSGPAQEELEMQAERLGIAARISWLGGLPAQELAGLWPRLDCLVIPSRTTQRWTETFSPPLIEAMGHGVTVIGSDSGVLPELIDTAGLVVPEDDVQALTAALQHLGDSPRERQRLGREGRLRVMSQYTDEALARRTLEFWERVVRGKRERS